MRKNLSKEVDRLNQIIKEKEIIISSKEETIEEHKHVYEDLNESKQIQHSLKESIVTLQTEIKDGLQREKDSKVLMDDLNKELKLVSQ